MIHQNAGSVRCQNNERRCSWFAGPQQHGKPGFENEWQSYRTRKERMLELTGAEHEYDYEKNGRYKIAGKVIDIFGNDIMKVVEIKA